MPADRPDPDQLLAEVRQQEARKHRGRLKVFFGMAAGVGKTFAMLEEARARAAEGLDVVVGYAEPHIRTETEALLLGMEILPYKTVDYHNARLKELDLDAALKRKPAVICVDELAHSNAPGMRHPKRWQDVAELLDAGIHVYTTLNVQHLESANDIVERVTGVRVRETLPDSVLEQADEVELVDIAPEELLERFREGKVYRPDHAKQAAKHFFIKGNLIALRELALRTTAQRVDAQMDQARREAGISSTWAATERVLVCVGSSPMSPRLVRSAKRLAASLKAEWIAAYTETPAASGMSGDDRQQLDRTLRLAENLGARTVTLTGGNIAEEVIAYAKTHNVTKIVVGKPIRSRWRDWLFGSVVDDLVRHSGEIDIYVIRGDGGEVEARQSSTATTKRSDMAGYAWAIVTTALVTAIGWPLYHLLRIENENILMLYLLAVLWMATHHSRTAAVAASVLSVAAFDFVFVPPHYTFAVTDRQYVITFLVMLLTALVISTLTHRVRLQADSARQRERRTGTLLALSRELAVARTIEEITAVTTRHAADALGVGAMLLLSDERQQLMMASAAGDASAMDTKELGVAQWAFEHEQSAGYGTGTLPASLGTYLPLKTSGATLGVLGLILPRDAGWATEQRQLAEALASQAAQSVERAKLTDEARTAWERVEAEFLRNTLLSGVSHELRTPLATITGVATGLADPESQMSSATRSELLNTLIAEAERMDRLINNLLDMTRLEAGGLSLKREWVPLQEIIGATLRHLDRRLQGRNVQTQIAAGLPLLRLDASAMEQVMANLLDNAVEYTPTGTTIMLNAREEGSEILLEVSDQGPGLPAGTEKQVFEKFFRAGRNGSPRGIGLGLAICRSIVEAHGGRIWAANRAGGGAMFTIALPCGEGAPVVDTTQ